MMNWARYRTVFATFIMACVGSIGLSGCDAQEAPKTLEPSTSDTPISEPLVLGTTHHLPSEIYGMDREINIYVPNIPDWGKDYFDDPLPILYVIDGGTEQDFFHIAGLSQLTLVNAERQPMIVVGIRTHDRRPEISPKATDPRYQANGFEGWGGSHTFRRHIVEEVKPFIEANYESGREAVIGESLAGLFIVEMLLEEPEIFDDYIAISPSMWWDDRRLSKEAPKLLEQHKTSDRRLYLTMADEGGTMRLGLDELITAIGETEGIVDTKFVDRASTDSHSSIYHHASRDALIWMYGIPSTPYGETPWYLEIGGQPPESTE